MAPSPNTALQRTRSAPLRSPLSLKTFGDRRLHRVAISALVALVWAGCARGRVHKYEIAADAKPGWVVIEFENAACPAVPSGLFARSIAIPASRYLCFSNPIDHGLAAQLYYQRRSADGGRRLKIGEEIFREGTFAFGMGKGPCRMVGEIFFFGPKQALVQSENFTPLYPLHHQGCNVNEIGIGSVSF